MSHAIQYTAAATLLVLTAFAATHCGGEDETGPGGTTASGTATGTAGAGGHTSTGGGGTPGGGGMGGTGGGIGGGTGGTEPIPTSYTCTALGDTPTDGIFTLRAFNGSLYAGLFGYGQQAQSMLFSYPPWQQVQPGLLGIGESVCAMQEYGGQLYANTEDSGDIFRSSDGSNWQLVHNGIAHSIGCGLAPFGAHLYALNYQNQSHTHGQILRSADGSAWSSVYDSGNASRYVRDIVAFDGALYVFAVDVNSEQGYMLTSSNGTDWTETAVGARYFRSHEWGGSLWVSSTSSTSTGIAGIWQFDGSTFTQVHQSTKQYVTEITDWHGALFAATSDGFKSGGETSSVLFSIGGQSWTQICEIDERAAWSIEVFDDRIFVGSWHYEQGGKLYEVVPD